VNVARCIHKPNYWYGFSLIGDWHGGADPDGLVQAVLAAGALVAQADGHVHPAERLEMLKYTRRSGLQPLRRPALEIFDQLARDIKRARPHGERAVENLFQCIAHSHRAWIVLWGAEHVATADNRIETAELIAIDTVRKTLGLPPGVLAISDLGELGWPPLGER
jgi:tellurite resistance protein